MLGILKRRRTYSVFGFPKPIRLKLHIPPLITLISVPSSALFLTLQLLRQTFVENPNDADDVNYDDFTCFKAVLPVRIDIKPGSDPNCFNNNGHGVIPVAILTTDTFDAASVDPSKLLRHKPE